MKNQTKGRRKDMGRELAKFVSPWLIFALLLALLLPVVLLTAKPVEAG